MSKTSPQKGPSPDDIKFYLDLYNQRDRQGLEFFRNNFGDKVIKLVRNKLQYYPDSDIVMYDSFERTWASGHTFVSHTELMYYVKHTAFNECLKLIQANAREKIHRRRYSDLAYDEDPQRDFDMHLIHLTVLEALDNMEKGIERDIIDGIYNENMGNKQLSMKHNMSDHKLRTYKSRAIHRFKTIFQSLLKKKLGI